MQKYIKYCINSDKCMQHICYAIFMLTLGSMATALQPRSALFNAAFEKRLFSSKGSALAFATHCTPNDFAVRLGSSASIR